MNPTYYKVVSVLDDGRRVSACVNTTRIECTDIPSFDKLMVVYPTDGTTPAKANLPNSRLFVLDDFEAAEDFALYSNTYQPEIWKCSVKDVKLVKHPTTYRVIRMFWDGTKFDDIYVVWDEHLAATEVTLLEKVWPADESE